MNQFLNDEQHTSPFWLLVHERPPWILAEYLNCLKLKTLKNLKQGKIRFQANRKKLLHQNYNKEENMYALKKCLAFGILALALGTSGFSVAQAKEMKSPDLMMARMMKLGAPSEHHKALGAFVGRWNYTVTMQMTPNSKPQLMKGVSENKWVLGNRFIQEDVTGADTVHPFQGMGLIGYDNIRHEYISTWVDSMSTGMMEAAAQYDPVTQTFKEGGSVSCPITGEKHRKFRGVIKILDSNHYTYEMYMKDANGKEFKSMEINYERAE